MDSIEILVSIRKIVRSLNLESKSIQKEFGLSIPQLLCLNHLEKCENHESNHKNLMELLCLNSSTVTGIVNRLENRGYIKRIRHISDKRVTTLKLTDTGLKLLVEAPNVLHDRLSNKLDTLSIDDREMVKKALEIITSAMEIKKLPAYPLLTSDEINE